MRRDNERVKCLRSSYIRTIGILLLFVVGFVAPVRANGPGPDWELLAA